MNTDSLGRKESSRDISVLQRLTRLVVETERLIRLADDITQHATTPQAKAAMSLISTQVGDILGSLKASIDPLYNLYEIDPGLKAARANAAPLPELPPESSEYDESALWGDVKKQAP